MRCTIIQYLGYSPSRHRYTYVLEAENGVIAREEAAAYIKVGTSFDLPDEEWSPETEEYEVRCDGCGHEFWKKSVPGGTISCPICGTEEGIPG